MRAYIILLPDTWGGENPCGINCAECQVFSEIIAKGGECPLATAKEVSGLDAGAYKKWLQKRSLPRVDSAASQLNDVMTEARKMGCYDAEDAIKRLLENTEGK